MPRILAIAIISPLVEIHQALTWRTALRPVLKIQALTELGCRRNYSVCTLYFRACTTSTTDAPRICSTVFVCLKPLCQAPCARSTTSGYNKQGTRHKGAGCRHTVQNTVVNRDSARAFTRVQPEEPLPRGKNTPPITPRRELPRTTLFMQDRLLG